MSETFHICVSIRGALMASPEEFAQSWQGVFFHDDGRPIRLVELRQLLEAELKKGHEIVPAQGCDNYDWVHGCKGHAQDPHP
jgi:hypothetical protein